MDEFSDKQVVKKGRDEAPDPNLPVDLPLKLVFFFIYW